MTALNVVYSSTKIRNSASGTTSGQPPRRPLQVLELAAVLDVVTFRQLHSRRDGLLHVGDEAPEVSTAHVGFDADLAVDVLAADLRRTFLEDDVGELRQRNHATARVRDLDVADRFDVLIDGPP